MKKFLREWLGIEKDKEDEIKRINLVCQAIDEIFNLKKKDISVRGKISFILFRNLKKEDNLK